MAQDPKDRPRARQPHLPGLRRRTRQICPNPPPACREKHQQRRAADRL